MRKRYQKIHRRDHTLPKKETGFKKDTYKDSRYSKSQWSSAGEQKSKGLTYQPKEIKVDLSSAPIPPRLKSVLRLMVASKKKSKQQNNNQKLLRFMVAAIIILGGINMFLSGGIDVGGVVKDVLGFVFVFGIIAAVVIPVAFITLKLEAVMSKDNAARVGAAIIIGLIFLFLYWLASNWGGGY